MNGQCRQLPDKGESSEVPSDCGSNVDAILCENKIKQEPIVKEEPFDQGDNIMFVSFPHTFGWPVGNLNDIKSEVKDENMKEKANERFDRSCEQSEADQFSELKPTLNKRKSKSSSFEEKRKKYMASAGYVAQSKEVSGKRQPITTRAAEKQHKCSSCEHTTPYKSHLIGHMRKHTGERPFPCTHCPKRFSMQRVLQWHMRTHVDKFQFSCSKCLQGFSGSIEKFELEAICNVRRYECYVCKVYSTYKNTHLILHMRVHTGERPFRCEQCSKRFTQKNHLKYHMKTHTNPRSPKYKCSVCYKSFAQQMVKEEHEVKCKRRSYECYLCKSFNNSFKAHLERHMRSHTGDKPFRCELYSKYFTLKGNLTNHTKNIHKKQIQNEANFHLI